MKKLACAGLCLIAAAAGQPALGMLELDRVAVTRLENGLTLLVLEEHAIPVVSVQMLYKVGGRDDPDGRMGLAHFFEHMAFRSSKHFPDTGLVSEIYAAGGEWHGYTWIDQTTYFATAPKDGLDLLLRIEADRLGRLDIAEKDVEAESGAVLAEMNGYENDPSTILFDAVLAAAFQAHPYGKNTIGYEGDVRAITHDDLVRFYRDKIGPGTAVLAVVGDVDAEDVARRVRKRFGKFKGASPPNLPPPSEPAHAAERRVVIRTAAAATLFKIAYPAPAAASADFPAFLVLQELAGGGSGVNFRQNDWGTPVRPDSALGGVAADLTTWVIPTAEPYVFLVSGSVDSKADRAKIEAAVETALNALASNPVRADALAAARASVKRELLLDLETTEDAAHQLAYFEGIGALEQLLGIGAAIDGVTAEDVMQVAQRYLQSARRTIGWHLPAAPGAKSAPVSADRKLPPSAPRRGAPGASSRMASPEIRTLANGATLILRHSPLSPTATVKVVVGHDFDCALCARNDPYRGYTSVAVSGLAGDLAALVTQAKSGLAEAEPHARGRREPDDPGARLEAVFDAQFEPAPQAGHDLSEPALIVIAGDIDVDAAASAAADAFGALPSSGAKPNVSISASSGDQSIAIPEQKSQAMLGYMVRAPAIGNPAAMPWRLALYLLSHDYEGRLGKAAISRRGLAYYIGSDYLSTHNAGLITLAIGVDPEKQEAMRSLMRAELERLVGEPPDGDELADAKRHLIGRRVSAAQSNREIADALGAEWLASGSLLTDSEFSDTVNAVTLEALRDILPAFANGDIITIKVGGPQP